MSGVPPPMVAASGVACLERVCGRIAPDAPECGYDQSAVPDVISGRPAPVRVGARPYQRIGIVESNRQIHGPFRRDASYPTAQRLQSIPVQLTIILDSSVRLSVSKGGSLSLTLSRRVLQRKTPLFPAPKQS
jgi:hypothetical protein